MPAIQIFVFHNDKFIDKLKKYNIKEIFKCKKNSIFSIVTATHNRGNYLKSLYKSLVAQSYKKIEWIIGNDGSSDNSDKLIISFIKEKN